MKCSQHHLVTPVYLKLDPTTEWPDQEQAFHLLSANGLFLCRNHRFFRSCVPAPSPPEELACQKPFLQLRYPKISRQLLESIVGFFDRIGLRDGAEAAVLLAYDDHAGEVVPIVPPQVATVCYDSNGEPYPVDLLYDIPLLPPHQLLVGDIHSHVDGSAYSSLTDRDDERHCPGLHLVVGRISKEPPEFHCEVIADGFRFPVRDLDLVREGYTRRRTREVPSDWMEKVTVRSWSGMTHSSAAESPGRSETYAAGPAFPSAPQDESETT